MNPTQQKIKFSVGCFLSALVCACGQSSKPDQSRSWTLEMSFPSGYSLVDDSETNAEKLNSQFTKSDFARAFFRDPVFISKNISPLSVKLDAFGAGKKTSFEWTPEGVEGGWSFAGCRSDGVVTACEYKPLFECLKRQSTEASESMSNGSLSSGQTRSLLLEWAGRCGMSGVLRTESDSTVSFKIQNGLISFAPSPLLSVLIYLGVWGDYEEAVVKASAVATIPAANPCERADGACLVSPMPLSACMGCGSLTRGQLHTVFFVEALRQDYAAVRSVLFIPQ